jgi:hypothetical protein
MPPQVFRNEGVSSRHNPEFTSVEVYQAYADYTDMMDLTESLLRAAATAVTGGLQISYQGVDLDLSLPFRRVSMNQLVLDATGAVCKSMAGCRQLAVNGCGGGWVANVVVGGLLMWWWWWLLSGPWAPQQREAGVAADGSAHQQVMKHQTSDCLPASYHLEGK